MYCFVKVTFPTLKEAERISSLIIKKKLAACVQLSKITSLYVWKGDLKKSPEVRADIKTCKSRYKELEDLIKNEHSYEVPEIISLDISDGNSDYLDWISEQTKKEGVF